MPIIDEDGRPRSIRTAEEENELLHRDIERLPPDEQAAVLEAIQNIGSSATTKGWKKAVEAEYARKPVDIRTFLTDHYFLGHIGSALWPQLVEDMVDLFEGDYHEAVLGGSLGWGKSFFATTAMAYVIYQMSCLRDPQAAYGIARGSAIYVAMLSTTEKVARRVAIQELIGKIEHSPYFREHFPHKAAPSNLEIRFPNQVWVVAGSTGSSAIIGLNAYAGFIDESSFMGEAQEVDRQGRVVAVDLGEQIHKSIIRRMKSRFQRVGRLPGVLITASSKEKPNAFIEKRVRDAREQEDPTFFVREYATWHVKPSDHFSEDTFTVVAGSERVASKILGKTGDVEQEDIDRYKDMGLQIVEVPIDYWDDFQRDIDGSLRDIAGVATDAVSNFMARTEKIFEASEDAPIVNPVGWEGDDEEDIEEWVTNRPLNIRWNAIAQSYERRLPGGYTEQAWRPLRHPSAPRYVHIDSSLTGDSTGIVIAHVARWKEVVRRDPWGEEYAELAPVIEVDLVLRITAAPGDEIMLADVRSIVYQFQAHGFNVSYASMDQYQSADSLQQFRKHGIEAELVSVDRTTDAYDTLKDAMYEGRVTLYEHRWLQCELRNVQRVPTGSGRVKIDHAKKMTGPDGTQVPGSKDVSDALAGVSYGLTQRMPGRPVPPMLGPTNAEQGEKADHSWVSGGKVMIQSEGGTKGGGQGNVPTEKGSGAEGPMPFIKG